MKNKSLKDSVIQKDCEESLVDLVISFLNYTDDLLGNGLISEELYHELRQEKIEFLKSTNKNLEDILKI